MQTGHRRGFTQSALMCTSNRYAPLEVVKYRMRAGCPHVPQGCGKACRCSPDDPRLAQEKHCHGSLNSHFATWAHPAHVSAIMLQPAAKQSAVAAHKRQGRGKACGCSADMTRAWTRKHAACRGWSARSRQLGAPGDQRQLRVYLPSPRHSIRSAVRCSDSVKHGFWS